MIEQVVSFRRVGIRFVRIRVQDEVVNRFGYWFLVFYEGCLVLKIRVYFGQIFDLDILEVKRNLVS